MLQSKFRNKRLAPFQHYWCRLIFVCLCSCLFLAACDDDSATSTKDWQSRWLKGIPCRPPCWEGITPGHTTSTEAVDILKKNFLIREAKLDSFSPSDKHGEISWKWLDGQPGGSARYLLQQAIPVIYEIHSNYPTPFLLGDLIKAYGQPSHIRATAQHDYYDKNVISYTISFVYLSQGFVLATVVRSKPILNSDLSLSGVGFFSPTSNESWVIKTLNEQPDQIVLWQGFKDFDFYCREDKTVIERKSACIKNVP